MTLRLRPTEPRPPFSWDPDALATPSPPQIPAPPPSPPTSWLSARDMKLFGAKPLTADFGVLKCKECGKPVLKSFMAEHAGAHPTPHPSTSTTVLNCRVCDR